MATESTARAKAHRAGKLVRREEEFVNAVDNIQRAVLAESVANSTDDVPVTVTGFEATLEVGSYLYQYYLPLTGAATTTGIEFTPSFSGTGTQRYSVISGTATATGMYSATATTGAVGPVDVPDAAAATTALVIGSIIVTVAGTLSLTFVSEVDESAATVLAGATMRVEKV